MITLCLMVVALVATGLFLFTQRTARRVESILPPKGVFFDLPGVRLHAMVQGQGSAILLIHGLSGQMHHFGYGVQALLAAKYRVIVVDRPGSGYSLRSKHTGANLFSQADTMAALITALQLENPIVVGHSLGGGVALALAQRHPHLLAGLALIAPLSHVPRHASPAFAALGIPAFLRGVFSKTLALPYAIYNKPNTLALVFGPETAPADFPLRGGALLGARPSHFVAACEDMAVASADLPAMTQHYPAMQTPVAVLFGRGDRILDPQAQGETLARSIPNATLALVDGGHMLPITQPQVTAAFIADFADKTRGFSLS